MKALIPSLLIVVWLTLTVSAFAGDYREEIPLTKRVLTQPTKINGISCRDSVSLYENGRLNCCILAKAQTIRRKPMPEGTVVQFYPDGVVMEVRFPREVILKDLLCTYASFHSNGKLYGIALVHDEEIQGIPCKGPRAPEDSLWRCGPYIYFWSTGKLKDCWLSKDFNYQGYAFKKNAMLRFNEKGELEEVLQDGKKMFIKH